VIPNRNEQIGSGLLARVSFESGKQERVLVPETVSQPGQEKGRGKFRDGICGLERRQQATVVAREVKLGEQANDKVEILSD